MYNKRKIKQKKLIKKLFVNIIKDLNIKKDIPLKIKFKNKGLASYCSTKSRLNIVISQVIGYNLYGSKFLKTRGYSDDYYAGRGALVNKYIKNNKHNAIRFILLHELKHAIDYRLLGINAYKNIPVNIKEKSCDEFAINYINKLKG